MNHYTCRNLYYAELISQILDIIFKRTTQSEPRSEKKFGFIPSFLLVYFFPKFGDSFGNP